MNIILIVIIKPKIVAINFIMGNSLYNPIYNGLHGSKLGKLVEIFVSSGEIGWHSD